MPVVSSEGVPLGGNDAGSRVAQMTRPEAQGYKERLYDLSSAPAYISAIAIVAVAYLAARRAAECVRRRRRRREPQGQQHQHQQPQPHQQPQHQYQRQPYGDHHKLVFASRELTAQIVNSQRLYSQFPRPSPLHLMEEKSRGVSGPGEEASSRLRAAGSVRFAEEETSTTDAGADADADADAGPGEASRPLLGGEVRSKADLFLSRQLMTRPPPPPPLTPPELSGALFTFDDPRRTFAPPADLPESFIHEPNPDYTSSSSTTASTTTAVSAQRPTDSASPSTPRRRSYAKTVPIGIPPPPGAPGSSTDGAVDLLFSPSSYPPSSPQLPPPYDSYAPTALGPAAEAGAAPAASDAAHGIDVQGEIISVMDDDGAGWKRHTRVYGGGVCLACAASNGGGYYGATVTPEEMR